MHENTNSMVTTQADVFFYEAFKEEEHALRYYLPKHIKAGFTWKTIQEEGRDIAPSPLISIRTQSRLPPSYANQLSGIITRSTGYDHIHDYWQQCEQKVPCGYLPLYCNRAVAEQTMLLWMSLLRHLPQQTQQFYHFNRNGLTGQNCQHKTLLIVGVGHIGYELVQIGKGLGMHVLGVDIEQKYADVSYDTIENGLSQADIVVCAMNLNAGNKHYFNAHRLKQGKKGVIFLNISRGELSPTQDLLELIENGFLGGVALDVYENEKELAVLLREGKTQDQALSEIWALAQHPNVILTPHNAFNTHEAVAKKSEHTIQQIKQFMEKEQFLWTVPEQVLL